ncbi:hypothetical protein PR048_011426 [Dryococelus australis]|uniref:Uncharacterized protein n=1 Tax=Dryococelus australis TaxID=614101 RepID=A0ABQ9HLQ1_9NEOP|nr:hypothetical protein PR048_011426 [Dryococelus australis]
MVSLPPHTSHHLKPLVFTFLAPLNMSFNRECDIYLLTHHNHNITRYELAELTAGIWPLNLDKFINAEDFGIESETEPEDINEKAICDDSDSDICVSRYNKDVCVVCDEYGCDGVT